MDGEDRYGTSRDTAPFASSPAYLLHRLVADEPDVGDAQALGAGEHFGDVLVFDQLVRPDVKLGLLGGVGRLQQLHFERSEEHTSELQSLMRTSYAVFCL